MIKPKRVNRINSPSDVWDAARRERIINNIYVLAAQGLCPTEIADELEMTHSSVSYYIRKYQIPHSRSPARERMLKAREIARVNSENRKLEARKLWDRGYQQKEIAHILQMTRTTVGKYLKGYIPKGHKPPPKTKIKGDQ